MTWFHFVVISAAIWRISNMFVKEDGPKGIFARMRYRLGVRLGDNDEPYALDPESFLATLLLCVWCISIYVAIPFFLLCLYSTDVAFVLALIPAFSAVACLIDRTSREN